MSEVRLGTQNSRNPTAISIAPLSLHKSQRSSDHSAPKGGEGERASLVSILIPTPFIYSIEEEERSTLRILKKVGQFCREKEEMAGRKNAYHFFAQSMENQTNVFASDEFDESDVWGGTDELDSIRGSKPIPSSRTGRKKADKGDRVTATAASLPVNIPDWSKILKDEYRGNNNSYNSLLEVDEEEDVGTGSVIPPHELLWRSRAASFSVHEGIGRTLKGRDLSRVRNAIFEKTGFED